MKKTNVCEEIKQKGEGLLMETILEKGVDPTETSNLKKENMEKLLTKTVLVTGASGFLGRRLVARLRELGSEVIKISRSNGVDVKNILSVKTKFEQHHIDEVYHLASKVSFNKRDEKEIWDTNVKGTQNLLITAKRYGIKKVVVVSSACTVGSCNNPFSVKDETFSEQDDSNPYVKSKIHQEVLAKSYQAIIVAPTTCYLPLMAGKIVPAGGTCVVDSHDVVEGMIYAMKYGKPKEKYILGGHNIKYSDLYKKAGRKFCIAPRFLKGFLKWVALFDRSWYMSPYSVEQSFRYRYYTCAKARKELGWEPMIKLETMLKQQS